MFAFFKIRKKYNSESQKSLTNDKNGLEYQQKIGDNLPSFPKNELQKYCDKVGFPLILFHPDIKDLLWFGDSPLKNIDSKQFLKTITCEDIELTYFVLGMDEPSLIFTSLPVKLTLDFSDVDKPPYYPTYSTLTPLQRGIYLHYLENPYRTDIDIGYVFILYYGLERHLLLGNWQRAAEIIFKLRKVHKNKSFQSYSASALILTAIVKKQGEIALAVLSSLSDADYLPVTEYFLCAYSFNLHITPREIMYYAGWFGFYNNRYIKHNTDLFSKTMKIIFEYQFKRDYLLISDVLSEEDVTSMIYHDLKVFANTSLRETKVKVPFLTENMKLREYMQSLLQETHDSVKHQLAEMRKNPHSLRKI